MRLAIESRCLGDAACPVRQKKAYLMDHPVTNGRTESAPNGGKG